MVPAETAVQADLVPAETAALADSAPAETAVLADKAAGMVFPEDWAGNRSAFCRLPDFFLHPSL